MCEVVCLSSIPSRPPISADSRTGLCYTESVDSKARWLAIPVACALTLIGCGGGDGALPPRPKRVVDLSPVLTRELAIRRLGARALDFLATDEHTDITPIVPPQPSYAFGLSNIHLVSHAGAHLDAPGRLLRGGEQPAQIALDHLVGPARIVDLRWHDRNSPIQITDLQLTPIESNDLVVLFVGYEPPAPDMWPRYANLSVQASEYLAAKRVRAVATDMPTIASFEDLFNRLRKGQPPEEVWAEYLPLFQAQIPILCGLVNLESLVDEPHVVLTALPLSLPDGNGAPARVAALVY